MTDSQGQATNAAPCVSVLSPYRQHFYLVVALDPDISQTSVKHRRDEIVADTFHLSLKNKTKNARTHIKQTREKRPVLSDSLFFIQHTPPQLITSAYSTELTALSGFLSGQTAHHVGVLPLLAANNTAVLRRVVCTAIPHRTVS